MSWSGGELKHKRTGRLAYDLENSVCGHYLFDDELECRGYFDFGFDSMVGEFFEYVHEPDITQKKWDEIFETLKRKALEYSEETKYTIKDIYV